MLLFWFGIVFQIFRFIILTGEYVLYGTIEHLTPEMIFDDSLSILYISYVLFIHFTHIVSGYWLSKGRKKGAIFGLGVGAYEILSFVIFNDPVLYTPYGMAIRILFAFVIYLIISGRKELITIGSENWRPWKNPKNEQI